MSIEQTRLPHFERSHSRRDFLTRAGAGFGSLALASLLAGKQTFAATRQFTNPIAPKPPMFPARAKSVIWCFLDGGPSHIDLFDPKDTLKKLDGTPLPASFKRPVTAMGRTAYTPLLASRRTFKQHGRAGTWVSDWYPEIATCVEATALLVRAAFPFSRPPRACAAPTERWRHQRYCYQAQGQLDRDVESTH